MSDAHDTAEVLGAELRRFKARAAKLANLLDRNTCPEAPRVGGACLHCGGRECAEAREFLDSLKQEPFAPLGYSLR